MPITSEAQKRAVKKYDAANTRQIHLKLNLRTDAAILDWLDRKKNVQGYIKELIKKDMEGKTMTYTIKPEYLDLWEGGDSPSNPDRIITESDLEDFAREWDKTPEELKEQLIPQE